MSKAIKILGTKIIKATATGNKLSQHISINWSYLSLGKVALNHTKIKQKIQVLIPNIIDWIFKTDSLIKSSPLQGNKLYPPKKKIAERQENKTIELYSAKKNITKGNDECSVKKPATNSDS